MKKVLVIGKYYFPYFGGMEHVTRLYAEHLSQHYEVTVLANAHGDTPPADRRGKLRLKTLRAHATTISQPISLSLPFAFRCNDYDLIHLHAPNPYAAVVLAIKMGLERHEGALVITHHMDIAGRKLLRQLTLPFYRYLARRARWVSVTSPKNHAVSQDLPQDAHVVALPLSIDPGDYDIGEAARARALAWRRATHGDAPLIGFIGRHARYKGLDVLVRALARLDNVHAVLAGDGPFRSRCMALAAELGIADRVHFPGVISEEEKSRLLLAIDVFAFPSTEVTEAFGLSQLEAMLHGAVVVASDLPTGVTDVAIAGTTALLATPGDSENLAAQINRALNDTALAARLRDGAMVNVRTNFANAVVLARLSGLIDDATATAPPALGQLHVA